MEKSTAKLWTNWPTRFCSDEHARRWRSSAGNGGAVVALSLRAVEAKEMQMELTTRSGRRAGCCSSRGRPCQGICGAWQHEQETGDECHPRGARCLMAVRYCSLHSDNLNRLTARLQRVNTAKPLIHCKNREHENCRPTIHLQLLFKDQRLILHGSEVTSSQSWLDPTKTGLMT